MLTNELRDVRDRSELEMQDLRERNRSLSRESQRSILYKQYPDIIIKPYNLKVLEKALDKGVNVHDVRCQTEENAIRSSQQRRLLTERSDIRIAFEK